MELSSPLPLPSRPSDPLPPLLQEEEGEEDEEEDYGGDEMFDEDLDLQPR